MFVQKRKEKKGAISFGKGQGCILPKQKLGIRGALSITSA